MSPELNSIARAVERLAQTQQKGPWDYLYSVTVLLTLGVVVWYTVETCMLRKAGQRQSGETAKLLREAVQQNQVWASLLQEAQRQNEVSLMPIVTIAVEAAGGDDTGRVLLQNIGLGPAFNLKIDRLGWDGRTLQFEHGSNTLKPGQEEELVFHVVERDTGHLLRPKTLCNWIDLRQTPDPFNVVVRCQSVNSRPYVFQFNITSRAGQLRIAYQGTLSL